MPILIGFVLSFGNVIRLWLLSDRESAQLSLQITVVPILSRSLADFAWSRH